MKSFISGSHAYGSPHKDSDVDLVVHLDDETRLKLVDLVDFDGADQTKSKYGDDVCQFKVGNLNLIMVDDLGWEAWKAATIRLIAMAPVTRGRAIEVHREEQARRGVGFVDDAKPTKAPSNHGNSTWEVF